ETLNASPDFFPAPELSSLCDRFPSNLDDIHRKIYTRCVAHGGAYPEPVSASVRERSDRLVIKTARHVDFHVLESSQVELPPHLLDYVGEVASPRPRRVQTHTEQFPSKGFRRHDRLSLFVTVRISKHYSGNILRHVLVVALPGPDLISHRDDQRMRHCAGRIPAQQPRAHQAGNRV